MNARGKTFISTNAIIALIGLLTACGGGSSEETVGYKLAAIDGNLSNSAKYEERIAEAAERCGETEISVADKSVAITQYLDTRGITESTMWVLEGILQAIPPSEAGTADCTEVISLIGTFRVGE